MSTTGSLYDAIILGSGPAGLSAALALSRVRRQSLIVSVPGTYRNVLAPAIHTVITREGMPPLTFLETAREELRMYGFARFLDGKVISVKKAVRQFNVSLEDGTEVRGRKLVIAMGSRDILPDIPGIPMSSKVVIR
jgi:thioredoxin reductase (NADPH)